MKKTIYPVPIAKVLDRFAKIPKNICVIGDKQMFLCYAKHELPGYITTIESRVFRLTEFGRFFYEFLAKHCSINATVEVYFH